MFIPQRYPYNPGGTGFGPTYAYQQHQNPSDFFVWTFAYDVSGMQSVVLKFRVDYDGSNPENNNDNDTYNGGSSVGSWQSVNMTYRDFPAGNVTNNPDINFFIMPDYIADEYYAQISGLSDTLVDYYVEAVDTKGNIAKTPIQHVYIGGYTPGGGQYSVSWNPQNPGENDYITITVSNPPSSGKLHWGVNYQGSQWTTPNQAYWPAGTVLFNGSGPAVESPLIGPDPSGNYSVTLGPFNNPAQEIFSIAFVIHYDNNTWDNNNGNDYHMAVQNQGIAGVVWEPQTPTQYEVVNIYVGQATIGAKLHWGVKVNGTMWQTPSTSYWPAGTTLFNGTGPAVESPMTGPVNGVLSIALGPFNNPAQVIQDIDFVIHFNNNTWNNNNGQDFHITINNIQSSVLDLRAFIEGPYNGSGMNNTLNTLNYLPLSQPFNTSPWNYAGTESVGSIPNAGIVDWALVELRDAPTAATATSSTVIARKAGFVLSDGKVVSTDGSSNMQFIINPQFNLFAVVYQRNHLSVMSAVPLVKTGNTYTFNFTTGSGQAYGGSNGHKQVGSTVWAMTGGDGNADGQVNNLDKNSVWRVQSGSSGYKTGDFNLDGQVNNTDRISVWTPNSGRSTQVPQ